MVRPNNSNFNNVNFAAYFPHNYFEARRNFLSAAEILGLESESHSIGGNGPHGEELTMDAAFTGSADASKALVVSSGLHGVEGFFGSAVQQAFLDELRVKGIPPNLRLVFLHALNPFGFAWLRRANENNIDLNRNFVRRGETYGGSNAFYHIFDSLVNARHRWSLSYISAGLRFIFGRLRLHEMSFKEALAGGQFDYPRGLFYGGDRSAAIVNILKDSLPRWIGKAEYVLHVDLHTGLGKRSDYKMLVEHVGENPRYERLKQIFGDKVESVQKDDSIAYGIRGCIDYWCQDLFPEMNYDLVTLEMGTWPAAIMMAIVINEHRAWFLEGGNHRRLIRAKKLLKEAFCPSSDEWRHLAVASSLEELRRGLAGL